MTAPSPETAHALLSDPMPLDKAPKPTRPVALDQRNACVVVEPTKSAIPTITEPSSEAAWAQLRRMPAKEPPKPTTPVASCHRNAWTPVTPVLAPTASKPSAETPHAQLACAPPGKSPKPRKLTSAIADEASHAEHAKQPAKYSCFVMGNLLQAARTWAARESSGDRPLNPYPLPPYHGTEYKTTIILGCLKEFLNLGHKSCPWSAGGTSGLAFGLGSRPPIAVSPPRCCRGLRRVILSGMMRIIAGQWRGRHLAGPPGDQTRPILDRAKAVLFDVLGAWLAEPGRLPPVAVLDLFCGTGTLGLEALSRGAAFCRFVERHRATAAVLRRNLDDLKVIDAAEVMETDATGCKLAPPPGGDHPERFELVFVDPPYRMLPADGPVPAIRRLLDRLATSPAIADGAIIVVRHAAGLHRGRPLRDGLDISPMHEGRPLRDGSDIPEAGEGRVPRCGTGVPPVGVAPASRRCRAANAGQNPRRTAHRAVAHAGRHGGRPLRDGPSLEPLVELECREVGNMVFRFLARPGVPPAPPANPSAPTDRPSDSDPAPPADHAGGEP